MKRALFYLLCTFALFFTSCFTTSLLSKINEETSKETQALSTEASALAVETETVEKVQVEKVESKEESLSINESEKELKEVSISETDEEYLRSIANVNVSKQTFHEDKNEIIRIIMELETVMEEKNYSGWVKYLDSESQIYWSDPSVLEKASARLPVKGLRLLTLKDYFTYIFIPSRKGKNINEIRYITTTSVKAVHLEDDADIVYYNFRKVDGKWKIHLSKLR